MRAFYFKIENSRDILNTTLLTMTGITAHKQSFTKGSKHNLLFNYSETVQINRQDPE